LCGQCWCASLLFVLFLIDILFDHFIFLFVILFLFVFFDFIVLLFVVGLVVVGVASTGGGT